MLLVEQNYTCILSACICSSDRTVFRARKVVLLLIGVPGHHFDEIGHEGWNQTLDDRRIASYNVLLVNIRLVVLGNHWEKADYYLLCPKHSHNLESA